MVSSLAALLGLLALAGCNGLVPPEQSGPAPWGTDVTTGSEARDYHGGTLGGQFASPAMHFDPNIPSTPQ